MKLTRSRARTVGLTIAATGLLVAASAVALPASAASTPPPADAATATAVAERLGDRAVGTYLDPQQSRMVVAVTDEEAARTVRRAGAVARRVKRDQAQLRRATQQLEAQVRTPGTAWAVDPKTNQVVVSYDTTVKGQELEQLKAAVGRLGDTARLESAPGVFELAIAGGDGIHSSAGRCSLGFNVRAGAGYYFLTAGHCGVAASTWYADAAQTTVLGSVAATSFPENDYAIVTYSNDKVTRDGSVNLYNGTTQDITSAGNAYVGQAVRRSGSTTQVRSGTVTALNASVNYSAGLVRGLVQTNVCAERGDSGGALFAGSTALGLTSGGVGNCTDGGTTYYQPITEPLTFYGVSVF